MDKGLQYDIKKIMRGIYPNDKSQETVVRVEIVMDGISEEMQKSVEAEFGIFVDKIKNLVHSSN